MNDKLDRSRQVVECGAAIMLDDMVQKYGVVFVHPELPLFRLHIDIDPEQKIITGYVFEPIRPETPEVQRFAICVRTPADEGHSIVLPNDKGLVDSAGRPL